MRFAPRPSPVGLHVRKPDAPPSVHRRRDHGGHGDDRHRGDDRLDGHAADRRPARRPPPLFLGVLVLSSDPDGDDRRLRQARRSLRAPADPPDRHRDLPRRLAALRLCLVDADADRLPPDPGRRRRRDPAGGAHRRRRHVHGRGARQGPGLSRQHLGHFLGGGAAGGRPDHPASLLGLDLLDQHPDRHPRAPPASSPSSTKASPGQSARWTSSARPSSRSRSRR